MCVDQSPVSRAGGRVYGVTIVVAGSAASNFSTLHGWILAVQQCCRRTSTWPPWRVSGWAQGRDGTGRVLMVEPAYKPTWDVPGGAVEREESPTAACRREGI